MLHEYTNQTTSLGSVYVVSMTQFVALGYMPLENKRLLLAIRFIG